MAFAPLRSAKMGALAEFIRFRRPSATDAHHVGLVRGAPGRLVDILIGGLIATAACILYFPRLLPGPGFNPDAMKYHFIGPVLGISHPPGSPLYLLATWALAHMPIGELAWRINAFSAWLSAAAAALLYAVALEMSTSRLAAAGVAGLLLVAPTFWQQSIIAEVYTFHAAWLIGSAWCLMRWHRTHEPSDLAWAAATYALSFGVHVMSWFLLPGWIVITLIGSHSILRCRRDLLLVTAGALLGMSTYAYYAIRPGMHPIYVEFTIDSVSSYFDYLTGSYFRRFMFAYSWHAMFGERLPWLLTQLSANVGLPAGVMAVVGLASTFVKDWRAGVFLSAPIALGCLYAMGYAVPDADVYALPSMYFLLVAAAVGFTWLWRAILRLPANRRHAVVAVMLVAVSVITERVDDVRRNRVTLDLSSDTYHADLAKRILASVSNHSTIVAGSPWTLNPLGYYLWARHARATAGIRLHSQSADRCDQTTRAIDDYLEYGPVFLTGDLNSCADRSRYQTEVQDLSRTLPHYLQALPEGRLVLMTVGNGGFGGIDAASWNELHQLGVFAAMDAPLGTAYAAVLVRTRGGFAGIERFGPGATVDVKHAGSIAGAYRAPFDIALSVANDSAATVTILAGGEEYARPVRDLQIVVFDASTGIGFEREIFETSRTTSLEEFYLTRIVGMR